MNSEMNYEEWEESIPAEITNDSLWKIEGLPFRTVCRGCGMA